MLFKKGEKYMPVIMKENVKYAYTDKGIKAHTLSYAEYQALSTEEKMNGDLYFIPDKQPEGNPSLIWDKLGTATLNTDADNVSDAVNELNSSKANKQWTRVLQVDITSNTDQTVQVEYPNGYSELLFTVQRLDTGRTIGTNTLPRDQFKDGACYVNGSYNIVSLAMNNNANEYVNGVFIYSDATHIEVAFNKGAVNLRARVFAR